MPAPPWSRVTGVDAVIGQWFDSGSIRRCLTLEKLIEAREASFAPIPADLAPGLKQALATRGIEQLYTHQVQAVSAAMGSARARGRHVVIATPTASGKSLCFHLPVLQALARDPMATALYLYPTKALSRDQEHSVQGIIRDAGLDVPAIVFDGDTPGDARKVARERSRILLTNPDMLHAGILPNHTRWANTFQGLRYVVVDELHTYRGVFGSHLAHVLARLRRIAQFHGSDPVFICATATIGNPLEHAARLIGARPEEVELVSQSGAPQASRQLYVYNPPIVNEELGVRASTLKASVNLAADLVQAKVPTIVFGPSRNSVEVMLKYIRARAGDVSGNAAIMGYRGGYLPDQRRRIEQGLREGEILCVVATNALELGIDIGDLDAVITAGYPGTVAGTWQRFGRAGRRGSTSVAVMVCSSNALDQYLAREPEYLLRAGAEEARIDPSNVEVLIQHLKCATFEAPFEIREPGRRVVSPDTATGESYFTLDPAATRDALEYLAEHGLVHAAGDQYHWAGEAFPATSVSLRNIGWDNFVIIDLDTDKTIAELDWRSTHVMLHVQAIYQHDAEQYQVERLDYDNHKAYVRKVKPDYFTTALTYRTVEVIEQAQAGVVGASGSWGQASIGFGDVKVVEKVTGYKKIKYFTHENAGYGDVHLPEMQMHTMSFWLTLPEALIERMARERMGGLARAQFIDGLRGLGLALELVSTMALMCEPHDIGRSLGDGADDAPAPGGEQLPPGRDPHRGRTGKLDPTLFLFDTVPGGVGLAERIFERANELLRRAATLIQSCQCTSGCPACVGPGSESGNVDASRKRTALDICMTLGLLGAAPARGITPEEGVTPEDGSNLEPCLHHGA